MNRFLPFVPMEHKVRVEGYECSLPSNRPNGLLRGERSTFLTCGIFFLILILNAGLSAMECSISHPPANPSLAPADGSSLFLHLLPDLKRNILTQIPETATTLKEALSTLKAYSTVNKQCFNLLNGPTVTPQAREKILLRIAGTVASRWLGGDFFEAIDRLSSADHEDKQCSFRATGYKNETFNDLIEQYKKLGKYIRKKEKTEEEILFVKQCLASKMPFEHFIQKALKESHEKAILFLEEVGLSPHIITRERLYIDLYDAIVFDNIEEVDNCIRRGNLDLNRPILGWTPLMTATDTRASGSLHLLQRHGANVSVTGRYHTSCLSIAAHRGYFEIVEQLIEAGAHANQRNVAGNTPLMKATTFRATAAEEDDPEEEIETETPQFQQMIHSLIDAGTNLDIKNDDGNTALMLAIIADLSNMAEQLINAHADLSIVNKNGYTALDLARIGRHEEIVELLTKAEAPAKKTTGLADAEEHELPADAASDSDSVQPENDDDDSSSLAPHEGNATYQPEPEHSDQEVAIELEEDSDHEHILDSEEEENDDDDDTSESESDEEYAPHSCKRQRRLG